MNFNNFQDVPMPDNADAPTPMDTTPDKYNIRKADIDGKDTGNLGAEITWKEYIENLGETDIVNQRRKIHDMHNNKGNDETLTRMATKERQESNMS